MIIQTGDTSLLRFSEDIKVPDAFLRAIEKWKEMNITEEVCFKFNGDLFIGLESIHKDDDSITIAFSIEFWDDEEPIYVYSQKIGTKEDLDKRRTYQNFDSISFSSEEEEISEEIYLTDLNDLMLFATDYFRFLNPQLSDNEIVAAISFIRREYFDDFSEENMMQYRCFPDGSDDPIEKLSEGIEFLEKKMYSYEDEDDDTLYQERFEKFLQTEPARVITENLIKIMPYGQPFPGKLKIYDANRLCMTIESTRQLYWSKGTYGNFIFNIYINQEQEQRLREVDLKQNTRTFTLDDDSCVASITLSNDTDYASKQATYYMLALGYDPSALRYEICKDDYFLYG